MELYSCLASQAAMPLMQSRRHQLLQLLLLLVAVAASHGDSSGATTYDPSMCLNPTYTCGGVSISYPFYLSREAKDLEGYTNSYCGYPGLGILCDDGKPILETTSGENCTVTSFHGTSANLSLADLDVVEGSCPRVDHNVTFGLGSWLDFPASTVDYILFFLGCNFTSGLVQPPTIGQITCPGFVSGYPGESFVFPDDSVPAGNWSQACEQVTKVPVLKHGPVDTNNSAWRNGGYGQVLRQGFQVSWENTPGPCAQCEESNGRCASTSSSLASSMPWKSSNPTRCFLGMFLLSALPLDVIFLSARTKSWAVLRTTV